MPYSPLFRGKKPPHSAIIINIRNLKVKTKSVCLLGMATKRLLFALPFFQLVLIYTKHFFSKSKGH